MYRFAIVLPVVGALMPAGLFAMSTIEAPTVDEARSVYSQCLSAGASRASGSALASRDAFIAAKSGCMQHRQALIEAANGNREIVAALDAIDDQPGFSVPVRTRAVRVEGFAARKH